MISLIVDLLEIAQRAELEAFQVFEDKLGFFWALKVGQVACAVIGIWVGMYLQRQRNLNGGINLLPGNRTEDESESSLKNDQALS